MHIASQIFDRFDLGESERRLLRMAALCHDLGHLPFSHTAESAVFGDKSHEWMTAQILRDPSIQKIIGEIECEGDPVERVIELATCKGTSLLGQMITDDVFGADRIDYLLRDGRCTGLPYGQVDYLQLVESVTEHNGQLAVSEAGVEACESILLARYFMFNRVYHHPLIKALTFHLSKVIEHLALEWDLLSSVERYISVGDAEVMVELKKIKEGHPLYEHAAAIINPEKAFQMKPFDQEQLSELQSDPRFEIDFFIEENPHYAKRSPFDFLVKRKNGHVVSASELATVAIPQMKHHFMYVRE